MTGAGAHATVIEATGKFRVLEVGSAATTTVSGVTITGGRPEAGSYGGGTFNTGHLLISNSIVTGNRATAGGGVANAGGTVIVSHSDVTGNRAPFYGGGGIQNGGIGNVAGTVEVIASTVAGNVSGGDGGGILNGQNGHPGGAGGPPPRSAARAPGSPAAPAPRARRWPLPGRPRRRGCA